MGSPNVCDKVGIAAACFVATTMCWDSACLVGIGANDEDLALAIARLFETQGGAAVYAYAQRPHAALLFVDFLLSPEGQKLYEDLYFGSPQKDYGFKRWYPEKGLTVSQYEQTSEDWHKLLMEITRK